MAARAQWSPNEKVALEVAIGAAFGGARAMATMKHVGLNVASDPLFTAAYTGVAGALVIVSADDPGMHSSQNEQDNRRYAVAAGVPMLEPSDSQEAYDFLLAAIEISERWKIPVLLRATTRVCHSYTVVRPRPGRDTPKAANFVRDLKGRVMVPGYARPAHRRLRQKLSEMAEWNEDCALNRVVPGGKSLGIITSGISFMHAREAAPEASVLKLGFTHPLPMRKIAAFAASVERCVVIEEGDPYLAEAIRAAGIPVSGKAEMYRFGELDVARVRRILRADNSPEPAAAAGKAASTLRRLLLPASCSIRCAARTASWPATLVATRWGRCRRSKRWIRASAWERAWGSDWVCAMSCRPSRPAGSSASSETALSSTAASAGWWKWPTIPRPAAMW